MLMLSTQAGPRAVVTCSSGMYSSGMYCSRPLQRLRPRTVHGRRNEENSSCQVISGVGLEYLLIEGSDKHTSWLNEGTDNG